MRNFRSYCEIKNAYRLAQAIITERRNGKIKTTHDLIQIGTKCAPKHIQNRYLAQVLQAIRIEVIDQMHALEKLLEQSADVLMPKGRLVFTSYHSLEDRLVKNYTKRGSLTGEIEKDFYGNVLKPFTEIVRHPIIPSDEEIERNSRARSAKLRIAERNG